MKDLLIIIFCPSLYVYTADSMIVIVSATAGTLFVVVVEGALAFVIVR